MNRSASSAVAFARSDPKGRGTAPPNGLKAERCYLIAIQPRFIWNYLSRTRFVGRGGLHPGDELLDPLVHRPERVLAEHRPLSLIVELQVHPVDGEVPAAFLRSPDEIAAQPGPGGLRGNRLGLEDRQVVAYPLDRPAPLEQVVQTAAAVH